MDGTELTGLIKDLDRQKGLIEEIVMDLDSGKRRKISPEEIKHAYLPPSGFDKVTNTMEFMNNATLWDSHDVDQEIISKGYAYFEATEVRIGKKTETLLLQLMNPHFSSNIKVFHDPFANETASIGIAGVTVAGGIDKSYFVKLGDNIAFKAQKKNYDEEFALFFKGCAAVLADEDAAVWNQFARHTFVYGQSCGN